MFFEMRAPPAQSHSWGQWSTLKIHNHFGNPSVFLNQLHSLDLIFLIGPSISTSEKHQGQYKNLCTFRIEDVVQMHSILDQYSRPHRALMLLYNVLRCKSKWKRTPFYLHSFPHRSSSHMSATNCLFLVAHHLHWSPSRLIYFCGSTLPYLLI